ncbi:MAG: zinc-ribbon domain-containing protein [Oscillospiraceae bacterium]|nr:zinc-ribbon domain-containing protein [Oscillospiraceae bacterium]
MFCPHCGRQLSDEMLFCPDCGRPIGSLQTPEPEAAPQPVEQQPQQPAWEQPQQPTWEQPQQPTWEQPQQPTWEQPQQPAWEQPQQPVWETPRKSPAVKASKAKVPHKKPGAGVAVLSIFLCVLLFLTGLYAALLGTVRMTFNERGYEAMMNDYDASEMTANSLKNGEVVPFTEFLEEVCGVNFKKDYGIKDRDLAKALNKPFVRDFLSKMLTSYTDSLFNNKSLRHALSKDNLVEFFEENDKELYGITGYSIFHLGYSYDRGRTASADMTEIDTLFANLGTEQVTWKWIEKESGINFTLISYFLSVFALIGAIVLAAAFIALIFLANRKSVYSAFSFTGMTCLILGGLLALIAGVGLIYSAITKNSLIKLVANPFALRLLLIGGVILAIGLIFFVACRKIYDAIARTKLPLTGEAPETQAQ